MESTSRSVASWAESTSGKWNRAVCQRSRLWTASTVSRLFEGLLRDRHWQEFTPFLQLGNRHLVLWSVQYIERLYRKWRSLLPRLLFPSTQFLPWLGSPRRSSWSLTCQIRTHYLCSWTPWIEPSWSDFSPRTLYNSRLPRIAQRTYWWAS